MMNLYLACRDCLCCLDLEVTNRSEQGNLLLESGGSGPDILKLLPKNATLQSFLADHADHRTELAGEEETLGYRHDGKVLPPAEELCGLLRSGDKDERLEAAVLGQSRPECVEALTRAILKDRSKPVQEAAASSLLHLLEFEKVPQPSELLEPLLARMEKTDPPRNVGDILALILRRDQAAAIQAADRLRQSLEKNPQVVLKALSVLPIPALVPEVAALLPDSQAAHTLCAWAAEGVKLRDLDLELLEESVAAANPASRGVWLNLLAYSGPEGRERVRYHWLHGDARSARWCERAFTLSQGEWVHAEPSGEVVAPVSFALPEVSPDSWELREVSHGRWVTAVEFSRDGTTLASGAEDGTVKLWNRAGEARETTIRHEAPITRLSFSPDGRRLISGSWDGAVSVLDLTSGEVKQVRFHNGFVVGCDFLDNERFFTSDIRRLAFWNASNREAFLAEHTTLQPPGCAAVSAEGDFLVLAGGSQAEIREAESGVRMGALFCPHSPGNTLSTVSFSPDGFHAAGGLLNGNVCVWANLHHDASANWQAHHGAVRGLAWGMFVATTGNDGFVRFWSDTGERLGEEDLGSPGLSVVFHPSGELLVAGHSGGRARFLRRPS